MLYKSLLVGGSAAAAVALWGCGKTAATVDDSTGDTTILCDSDSTGAQWVACITAEIEACQVSDDFTTCINDSVDWGQIDSTQITAIIAEINWDSDEAKDVLSAISGQYSDTTVDEISDLLADLGISISDFSNDDIVTIVEAFDIDYSSTTDVNDIIELAISLGLDLDTITEADLTAILEAAGVEDAVITEVVEYVTSGQALSAADVPSEVSTFLSTSTDSEFTAAVDNMYLYIGSELVAVDNDDGDGAIQVALFTYVYTLHAADTITEDQLTALADATNVWEMMIAYYDAGLDEAFATFVSAGSTAELATWPDEVQAVLDNNSDVADLDDAVANLYTLYGSVLTAYDYTIQVTLVTAMAGFSATDLQAIAAATTYAELEAVSEFNAALTAAYAADAAQR